MTLTELVAIAAGLGIGYWLVNKMTKPSDWLPQDWGHAAATPDTSNPVSAWHEVLGIRADASDAEIDQAYAMRSAQNRVQLDACQDPLMVDLLGAKQRILDAALAAAKLRDSTRNQATKPLPPSNN